MSILPQQTTCVFGRAALLLMLLFPSLAMASGTSAATGTVLVLPVGEASNQILLQNNAAAPLRKVGLGVVTLDDASLAGFEAQRAVACLDADEECADVLRKAPAQWILLLQIRSTTTNPDAAADQTVIAKLYAANDGSLLQIEQRLCQRCSSRERLARITSELVSEVASAELASQASETYINVASTPPNAVLVIDGKIVGPTGQPYRVPPGEHKISVRLEGFREASQTVTVQANEHKALTVGLGQESVASASGTGRRILTWSSIGLGVGALGVGATWIAIDGSAVDGSQSELRDTRTLGIASMITGTVLLGAGITLLLTDSDGTHKMQVSAAPLSKGLALGLRGQF